jgi:ABC-2 type transport system ATP-binding protein
VIETRGLTKTFLRKKEVVEAVKDVSLDVGEGELVAILGPNGAGKSTTLRMLTSLLRPTSGTARVAGYDVVEKPADVRRRIGYIGQGNSAGSYYKVRDELHNQGRFYGMSAEKYAARATELLEVLELSGLDKRTPQSLSGGQRRRLDVALGLMHRPPLLFLDEPTTGLDPHSRANLWEHILQMRAEYGTTLVLTTHYLDEADAMAERVVVIDHGAIIADAPPAELKRNHADDVVTVGVTLPAAASPTTAPSLDGDGLAARMRADLLGPGESVEVGTDASSGSASGSAPGSASGSTWFRVTTTLGADRLPAVLFWLREHGCEIRSAELRQASLDDVFLNLTGRSLREEAAA